MLYCRLSSDHTSPGIGERWEAEQGPSLEEQHSADNKWTQILCFFKTSGSTSLTPLAPGLDLECVARGSQRAACRNWFCPSPMWVLKTELRSLGLVASVLPTEPSHQPQTFKFVSNFCETKFIHCLLHPLKACKSVVFQNSHRVAWHHRSIKECFHDLRKKPHALSSPLMAGH